MTYQIEPTYKQFLALQYLGVLPLHKKIGDRRVEKKSIEGYPVWDILTTQVGYGGAAGGGKSWLLCTALDMQCKKFPRSRRFIGRKELKRLKQSTLLTMFDIYNQQGINPQDKEAEVVYNEQRSTLTYRNGSQIYLLDLDYMPSDPLFSRFGSTEFTGGAIDEANECSYQVFDILQSRIRYKLESYCQHCGGDITKQDRIRSINIPNPDYGKMDPMADDADGRIGDPFVKRNEYLCTNCHQKTLGLTPKIITSFNPDKGWVYRKFYKPTKDKSGLYFSKFIPALVTDNPHISEAYITSLKRMNKVTRERLLYGNFDYDDTPGRLYDYESLIDMFNKKTDDQKLDEKAEQEPMYNALRSKLGRTQLTGYYYRIICDPARHGRDFAVVSLWNGRCIEKMAIFFSSDITELEDFIRKWQNKYNVKTSDILVDEGGVGGGLKDALKCRGFIANLSPIQPKSAKKNKENTLNYFKLKDQCYFELNNYIEEIAVSLDDVQVFGGELDRTKIRDMIIEDLDAMVQVDMDKDVPLRVIGKDALRKKLGRSTDFGDLFMMRTYFEVKGAKRAFIFKGKK